MSCTTNNQQYGSPEIDFKQPHEIIVHDMAHDFVESITGLGRKVDRALNGRTARIIMLSTYTAAVYEQERLEEQDLAEPELFGELHAKQVAEALLETARNVGINVLSYIGDSPKIKTYFANRPLLTMPNGSLITPRDWSNNVWAPDYTSRFAEVVASQDGDMSAEVQQ